MSHRFTAFLKTFNELIDAPGPLRYGVRPTFRMSCAKRGSVRKES